MRSGDREPNPPTPFPAREGGRGVRFSPATNRNWLALLNGSAFSATLVWSLSYAVVKLGLGYLTPLSLVALRLFISAPLLLALAWTLERRVVLPARSDLLWFLIGGVCFGASQTLWVLGLQTTPAGTSALLIATSPVLAICLAALVGMERFRLRVAAGVVLAFAGTSTVLQAERFNLSSATTIGALLTLGSALAFAVSNLVVVDVLRRYRPVTVTAFVVTSSTVVSLPPALGDLQQLAPLELPLGAWLVLAYISIVATVIARIWWYVGIQRVGAAGTVIYTLLEPVLALFSAALILGERPTRLQSLGALAVIVGIALARGLVPALLTRKHRRRSG